MIDRINSSNNLSVAYERSGKKAARVEGDAPAFLLPGEEDGGVVWDRGEKGKDNARIAAGKKREEYIPSGKKEEATLPESEEKKDGKEASSGILSRIAAFFKGLLSRLWYGDEEAPKKDESAVSATAEKKTDKETRIRESIEKKDTDALVAELTEGGKLKPARNTSLLTHYDRFGRIVKLEDTDVGRILRGERTTARQNVVMRPQGNYRRYV